MIFSTYIALFWLRQMITHLDRLVLTVKGIRRSVAFYTKILCMNEGVSKLLSWRRRAPADYAVISANAEAR